MKGSIFDFFFAVLLIIPGIITLMAFLTATQQVNPVILNITGGSGTQAGQAYLGIIAILYDFDYVIFFVFIALAASALILAGYLNSDPRNYAVGFLVLIILTFISFYLSNALHAVMAQPTFAYAAAHMPYSLNLIANLPLYMGLFLFIYLVMVLLKLRRGDTNKGGGIYE